MTKTAAEKLINPSSNQPIKLGAVSSVPFPSKPPNHLDTRAKKIWRELSQAWGEVLTGGDVRRFEKHCILEGLFLEAYEGGDVDRMIKYLTLLEKGYRDFGGTPLARLKFPGEEVSYSDARKGKVRLENGKLVENILD